MSLEDAGYVFYGSVPWDTPWLTEQNLARALAGRHRVLYVEPAVTPLTPLRSERPADDLRALARRRPRDAGPVRAFRPLAVPPRENLRARRIAAPLVARQVRRAAAGTGLDAPVVVAARSAVELLGAVGERFVVFLVKDLVEAGGPLLGLDRGMLAAEVDRMCRAADLVCATSPRLQEALVARGFDAALLPHGFHSDLASLYDRADPPAEYLPLARPLLGYTGRIDARLDLDLLGAVADRFRTASIALVGAVSPRLSAAELEPLTRRPNVHFLGPRRREQLPAYVSHLDCSLMPYRDTEWLRHASPLKLWDYLYAGPPIVGSGCAALRDYPLPMVAFAERPDDFIAAVEAALAAPDVGREQRRSFALENSWEARAEQLEGLVAGAMEAREGGPAQKRATERSRP